METTWKNYTVTGVFKGIKAADWGDNMPKNKNHHIVTVKNNTTGEEIEFDFWCSIAHPTFEKEYDLLNAFYCFLGDAISGNQEFEEFCREFGYDTDSRKAEKTWQGCKEAYFKALKLIDGDLYDTANELQEIAA